ncbi:enolase C-terminal domain-like protein [Angustibacter sp. Root456]|uniref:enolase C-terminal domain-like protein n=1 Tax=Angustibacter sp. Root456 TaxID=1736539 RepID=UPI0006FBAE18|nr:enolase C-terminal domain-like protein [Angustibacter sp. Root456]KQX62772.1 mandelate racemase [Angustibacter sp. Root456]
MAGHSPVVEDLRTTVLTVPTDAPESDGTAQWTSTTMVVVRVRSEGVTGLGWTYGPAACGALVDGLLRKVVVGRPVAAATGTWDAMVHRARNATRAGAVGYAISAVDVALWDLKARLLDTSLADLLGRAHDEVPVYGSGGFTSYDDDRLTEQLRGWVVDQQIPRVKIKIGHPGGVHHQRDVERMMLSRHAIGADAELFVDANGAYTAKQAVRAIDAAQQAGADVTWFEEPVSSDDLDGLRLVREHTTSDVAAGEYGTDVGYFRRMCVAGAVDCLQADATRCGGYTEWLRAAAVAASFELDVSAHCAPNLHAPVAAAAPNLRHIEWFHDHVRIEQLLLRGALDPQGGSVTPDPDRPGHGLTFDDDAAERFVVPTPGDVQ